MPKRHDARKVLAAALGERAAAGQAGSAGADVPAGEGERLEGGVMPPHGEKEQPQ